MVAMGACRLTTGGGMEAVLDEPEPGGYTKHWGFAGCSTGNS